MDITQTQSTRLYTIRAFNVKDSEAISVIYNQSIAAKDSTMDLIPKSGEYFRQKFLHSPIVLVLDTATEPTVGYAYISKYSDRPGYSIAGESSVYVNRDHLGNGYGTALMTELMDLAKKSSFHHLVAKIWASNTGSINLHKKFGYSVVGIQKEIGQVKPGEYVDVCIMQKLLSKPSLK